MDQRRDDALAKHMDDRPWFESFFGSDYLEIYEQVITSSRTEPELEGIVSLLRIEPGAKILDLACGHGRHSIPLAKKGFDVTGYDLSEVFLDKARADAESEGAEVRWIRGDMRELPFDNEFDAVINIFTAFGYFEDPEDDLKTLRRIHTALRTGGKFLIETLHRDALPARFQAKGFDRTSNGSLVLRERHWDLARDVIDEDVTMIRPDGSRTAYKTSVRMRSLSQLIAIMKEAGLKVDAWYGGLDGRPLDLQSFRLVVVSRKT